MPGMLSFLLNRKMLGVLLNGRRRRLAMGMRDGDLFLSDLDKYSDRTAIIFGEKRFTYQEFKERINRLNNGLYDLGIKSGDHIAALLGNSNAFAEVIYGTGLAGITTTPINWHLKGNEIEYIVNNSDSKAIIMDEEFLEKVMPVISEFEYVENSIVVGDNVPEGMLSYEELLAKSSADEIEDVEGSGGFMLYTSGTTGRPKGAHTTVTENASSLSASDAADFVLMLDNFFYGFDFHKTTNIHLIAGPLYHAAPLLFAGVTIGLGGTLVMMRKFDAKKALETIEREKISTAFMAPILLKRILDVPDKEKFGVSSMKVIICAAAPCPAEIKKEINDYFGPVFYEFYGSTDAGINTILRPKHYLRDPEKYGSVGKVAPGNMIRIIGDDGKEAPVGEAGDLYLTNSMVRFLEYYKDPEKTKNSFFDIDNMRYFIEGEIASVDSDGFFYILDRKKDMIISGGVNVYPAEIEEVIHLHPSVLDVAIIGVPDPDWGEAVKAFVVLKEGLDATDDEIIKFCDERLAGYKRPKYVDFISDIPRHPDGKLLKRELKEMYGVNN
ncbi:MAG: AMP-binding protein [Halobacteriota archaeon]|nr:AMP-binding protein [Halobacteriota archaeon]